MDSSKRRFGQQVIRLTGMAAAACLLGIPAVAAQAAPIESRTINPPEFDVVTVDVPATFTIRIGRPSAVRLSAEPNVLKVLAVTSQSGELRVSARGSFSTQQSIDIQISTPSLKSIEALGASEVLIGALNARQLHVTATGSTTIFLDKMNLQRLVAHLRESSEVQAAGSATSQQIKIDGSASYDGLQLKSDSAALTVSDSGSAEVNVSQRLDVSITDAGSVTYQGRPSITKSVSDAGSLDTQ